MAIESERLGLSPGNGTNPATVAADGSVGQVAARMGCRDEMMKWWHSASDRLQPESSD